MYLTLVYTFLKRISACHEAKFSRFCSAASFVLEQSFHVEEGKTTQPDKKIDPVITETSATACWRNATQKANHAKSVSAKPSKNKVTDLKQRTLLQDKHKIIPEVSETAATWFYVLGMAAIKSSSFALFDYYSSPWPQTDDKIPPIIFKNQEPNYFKIF